MQEGIFAQNGSTTATRLSGTIVSMAPDRKEVGKRLRAAGRDAGFRTTVAFAEYLGQERGTVDAWINGRAYPQPELLVKLHTEHGVTLDWLFYDDPSGLQQGRYIRLMAAMQNLTPPPPDAAGAEGGELTATDAQVASRPRRKKKKTAT